MSCSHLFACAWMRVQYTVHVRWIYTCFISGFHSVSIANKSSSSGGGGSTSIKYRQKKHGRPTHKRTYIWNLIEYVYRFITTHVHSSYRTHARTHRRWEKKRNDTPTQNAMKMIRSRLLKCAEEWRAKWNLNDCQTTNSDQMLRICCTQNCAN